MRCSTMPEVARAAPGAAPGRPAWARGCVRVCARLVLAGGVLPGAAMAGALPAAQSAAAQAGADLRLGQVEFAACEVGAPHGNGVASQRAFCTTFDVPENWDDPGARHIGLHVAIVRTLAPEADPDLVVFLDGGPGGAATEDYPALAGAFAPLRKRHHILLIDQRGTGASNALACDDTPALDADHPAPHSPWAALAVPGKAAQQARIRDCVRALAPRADPRFYATTDAVRDLEALRQALGSPQLDLVGVSYGTRVAQRYATQFPQAVRSVVLDSAVPSGLVLMRDFAGNLEQALQGRLARCRADAACTARYGDPYANLRQVRAQLRRAPQMVELHDPQTFAVERQAMGADELAALVRFYMYSAPTSALLPYLISEARAGRFGPLLAQEHLVAGDMSERLNGGMSASVLCTEDADLLRERPQDEDTVLGGGMVRAALTTCAAWPHRGRPADFHAPFHTAAPVLVLAGEFDPVTPPRYGSEIVAALDSGRARLLLAPGQGHAVLGIGCMPRLVGEFVRGGDPARLDDACLRVLGDMPPFLGVNGPAP